MLMRLVAEHNAVYTLCIKKCPEYKIASKLDIIRKNYGYQQQRCSVLYMHG